MFQSSVTQNDVAYKIEPDFPHKPRMGIYKTLFDALPSPGLNPLEGPTMLSCRKLGLGRRSRLPALERGRGAC
jgi:hypothetical protein